MHRRKFILACTALAASAPACLAQNSSRIKTGFLGVSHSHGMEKLRLILGSTDFELIGVAEPKAAVADAAAKAGAKIVSRDQVLAAADLVIVESAVEDHAQDALVALSAGKHLHVEKPPATDLKTFKKMVSIVREKSRLLQVGYMWRSHPGFRAIFEMVQRGWLGQVYQVRAAMHTQLAADRRPEWAQFKGGAMFEQGCHLIDPMVRLLGAPRRVLPLLKHTAPLDDKLEDNNAVLFEFAGNALGLLSNSTLQPSAGRHRYFEVLGANGTASLKPIEPPALTLDLQLPAGPYKTGLQTVPLPEYKRYAGEFQELAAAIRGQGQLAATLDQELLVQEAVLAASGH